MSDNNIPMYRNYDFSIHPLYFEYPKKMVESIIYQYGSELELDFPGFVDIYENLSKIIPNHFTIIDFGCYLAAQCWYFRNHIKYIGVDYYSKFDIPLKRFSVNNTYHYYCDIEYFMEYLANDFDPSSTFAICSYVHEKYTKLISSYFTNCFCYFPHNYERQLNKSEIKRFIDDHWIRYCLKNHNVRLNVAKILKENGYGND